MARERGSVGNGLAVGMLLVMTATMLGITAFSFRFVLCIPAYVQEHFYKETNLLSGLGCETCCPSPIYLEI